MFARFWSFLVGLAVLAVVALVGPQWLQTAAEHPFSAESPDFKPSEPVRRVVAPNALYWVLADMLLEKLRPKDWLLTFREHQIVVTRTAMKLREDLGLELPTGFVLGTNLPSAWLDQPTLRTFEHYGYRNLLLEQNREYLRKISARLIEEHATRTLALMSEVFTEVQHQQKPADTETHSFVKALYGDQYAVALAATRAAVPLNPRKRTRGALGAETGRHIIPAETIARAEAEVASLWRTEFSSDELVQARDYLLQHGLAEKMRDDLRYNDMAAAEKGLMEKGLLGWRLLYLHGLTRQVLAGMTGNERGESLRKQTTP